MDILDELLDYIASSSATNLTEQVTEINSTLANDLQRIFEQLSSK